MDTAIAPELVVVAVAVAGCFLAGFLRSVSGETYRRLGEGDPMEDRSTWRDRRAERRRPPVPRHLPARSGRLPHAAGTPRARRYRRVHREEAP